MPGMQKRLPRVFKIARCKLNIFICPFPKTGHSPVVHKHDIIAAMSYKFRVVGDDQLRFAHFREFLDTRKTSFICR